jgi:hypothetical protein
MEDETPRGSFRLCDFDNQINRQGPFFCQQRLWEIHLAGSVIEDIEQLAEIAEGVA